MPGLPYMTIRVCPHCQKPVVLEPSAAERARKFGGSPKDYVALFPMHAKCQLEQRDGKKN